MGRESFADNVEEIDVGHISVATAPASHLKHINQASGRSYEPDMADMRIVVARTKGISGDHDFMRALEPVLCNRITLSVCEMGICTAPVKLATKPLGEGVVTNVR